MIATITSEPPSPSAARMALMGNLGAVAALLVRALTAVLPVLRPHGEAREMGFGTLGTNRA